MLSERVRSNSEAAPWVVDEIKLLENDIERLRAALQYCACTCAKSCGKHVDYEGEIVFVECSGWVARLALEHKASK